MANGAVQTRNSDQNSRKTPMESRARHFLATEKIQKIGCSMGKKNEILGRLSGAWDFALLDTGMGQMEA